MASDLPAPSARKSELLELAYQYAIEHGRADLSLRPMAAAIGSSPRVLLYLFGSKDGLTRALLARSRADELALLAQLRAEPATAGLAEAGLPEAGQRLWAWLAHEARRPLLRLWLDGYARSLSQPAGPWAGFGQATVADWLALLSQFQPPQRRHTEAGLAERTLLLTVLRGALLDLLASDDADRTTAAVQRHLATLDGGSGR